MSFFWQNPTSTLNQNAVGWQVEVWNEGASRAESIHGTYQTRDQAESAAKHLRGVAAQRGWSKRFLVRPAGRHTNPTTNWWVINATVERRGVRTNETLGPFPTEEAARLTAADHPGSTVTYTAPRAPVRGKFISADPKKEKLVRSVARAKFGRGKKGVYDVVFEPLGRDQGSWFVTTGETGEYTWSVVDSIPGFDGRGIDFESLG